MLSGRALLGLGCVVALAVMVGIIGAVTVLGGLAGLSAAVALAGRQTASEPTTPRTPPTPAYVESMKPIPGRIDVLREAGVTMTADRDGGESWFLANGTKVQIVQTAGPISQAQVMSGPYANRVGWIMTNAVST